MILYALLISLIFLFRMIFDKKIFCLSSGILLWLVLALRNIRIGLNDTLYVYKPFFEQITRRSFNNLISDKWFEIGFSITSKFLSYITSNYQVYIAILAIPFIFLIIRYIYCRSSFPLLSIIIFLSLYYLYGTFLLRQVIAIGLFTLAIDAIEMKNIKKFIFWVIVASLFHKSALVLLIAYPFSNNVRFSKMNYVFILIAYVIATFFGSLILNNLSFLDFTGKIVLGVKNGIYSTDANISMFGFLIDLVIIIFSDFLYMKNINNRANIYLNLATLGAMLFCFSKTIVEFYRISMYFSFVNIVLIPDALERVKDSKYRFLIELALLLVFIAYFLLRTINNVNANPFYFFF